MGCATGFKRCAKYGFNALLGLYAAIAVTELDAYALRFIIHGLRCDPDHFTDSWEVAQAAIKMGFYISFSGIVTFKNAVALKDVAQKVPLASMLIETDSPYLAPIPFRGKTNQPAYVRHVAEEIARLRDIPLQQVMDATTSNFFSLFKHAQPCN